MQHLKNNEGFLSNKENAGKILEMTADTMFLLLKDGTCVDLDIHTDRWYLQNKEKIIGQNLFSILPSETSIALKNNFEKVLLTRKTSVDNYEMQLGKKTYYFKCIINYYSEDYILCQYRDITQRIILKQNLEKANKQLQEIEKVALIGHWILNSHKKTISYNGYFSSSGNSTEYKTLSTDQAKEMLHPDDRDYFEHYIKNDIDSKNNELVYFRMLIQGKIQYIRFRTINRYFEEGNKILEGYIQNITDFTEKQHKLEMVNQAVSKSTDYIFAMTTDGDIVFGNQRFKEIHGWSETEDISGANIKKTKNSQISNYNWAEIIHQVTTNKQLVSFVFNTFNDKSKTTQSFDCTSYLFKDSFGQDLVWTFGKNITERIHYEKQVKELNQIMSTVLNNIPMFISVKDVNSNLSYIFSNNSGGDFRSGLSGQFIGKSDFDIFPDNIAEEIRTHDIIAIRNEGETKRIIEDLNENGEVKVTDQIKILINDEIRPLLLTIETDITERKQMEEELLIAKNKAEQSDKLKSAFIANMSHEIRTPLNAIVGFSRIMAETPDDEERRTYYSIVEDNNERLLGLVNEILDLSKIESGIMEFETAPLKLNDFGEDIMNTLYLKCPNGVELIFEPGDKNTIIFCDRNRLFQVFINLINNSIKFTSEGSIRFGYTKSQGYIDFFVKDTGKGISPEKLDKVFDRFVKADNFTQGTGLGLSICKSIVERMGGDIKVSSRVGEGTCFNFRIPESGVAEKALEDKNSIDQTSVKLPEDCTILVAEDTESNFKLIEAMIGKTYKLIRASNGVEAVSLFNELQPDLILMDIKMPEMNGLEATQIIRKNDPEIPIIVQSAYAFEDDRKKAIESGCTDFIAKPFTKKQLTDIIQKSFSLLKTSDTDNE